MRDGNELLVGRDLGDERLDPAVVDDSVAADEDEDGALGEERRFEARC